MGMGSVMESSDVPLGDPIVPKSECLQDGYTSSSASTPEAEIGPSTQDVVQVQKRKGGRKPVHSMLSPYNGRRWTDHTVRYMLRQRSVNKGTGKHRLPSENGGQNISSNLRTPSSIMRILCKTCSRATVALLMNV
jgi:hypothetical protein